MRETTSALEWFNALPRLFLLMALAVLWAALLSTSAVQRVFRPLVEPRLDWLRAVPAAAGLTVGTGRGAR
ncbi:hypothetical protein [Modestobacter altitudinis]|uniref:hypothetical protein n=1 Tax=Modestobacter altitudinis TaxID=2213158 RepID=UPI001486018A|nr:hypothetical protein [Modestobacter altitudinis]